MKELRWRTLEVVVLDELGGKEEVQEEERRLRSRRPAEEELRKSLEERHRGKLL